MIDNINNGEISKEDFLTPSVMKNRNTENNFYSSDRGQYIVNALTGETHPYKVGSKEELLFWRVIIPYTKDNINDSIKLFYNSPQEYEFHRNMSVPVENKIYWLRKNKKKSQTEIYVSK